MHIFYAHVPYFLQQYKCLKIFTGQGVEKNNDTARNAVRRKTNHRDSVGDILRIEHRQRQLKDMERMHRAYVKTNSIYWEKDIFKKRDIKKEGIKRVDNILKLRSQLW